MRLRPLLAVWIAVLTLVGCGGSSGSPTAAAGVQVIEPNVTAASGDRRLGIAISESEKGFGESFIVARQAGIQVIELNLPWDAIETAPGQYQDPWGLLSAIQFYGEHEIQVILSLAVINTVERTDPEHLRDKPFDDPAVISAFNNMADWVIGKVPDNVTIAGVSIGNEVDLYLDEKSWPAYIRFFRATRGHLREHNPGLRVGCKITAINGVLNKDVLEQTRLLNRSSDVVMLNYYPQDHAFHVLPPDVVHSHFEQIADAFPGREAWLTEVGYQSGGRHCSSSEAKQARFFHEFFAAWDNHRSQFKLVMINWLHDQDKAQIDQWTQYYGSTDPGFVEFLSTLGLRNHDDTDKAAWLQLLAETRARGWTPE